LFQNYNNNGYSCGSNIFNSFNLSSPGMTRGILVNYEWGTWILKRGHT